MRPSVRWTLLLAAILFLILLAGRASADVLKIVVDDVIHAVSDEFIGRALDEAQRNRDSAVLVILRTPGGMEDAMRKIVNRLLASPVPVIVYVAPGGSRATSAGFFILEAADVAAMAPGTNTGAAHPVMLGSEKIDEIMKQKMESDAAALMRSIAAKRGRNVALAEAAVRQSRSFTEQEALRFDLIDIVAASEGALLRDLDGHEITRFSGRRERLALAGQPVRTLEMTLRQKVLSFIMNPNVAFILFTLGMFALWAEVNTPGAILPGVVGALAVVLSLIAFNLLPTRYASLALILVGFVLIALEATVTSHGVLGVGGTVALFIGGLMLVDGPIPELRVNWITALAVSVGIATIAVFLATLVVRTHRKKPTTGQAGMIGEIGTAETDLAPSGRVFVHGEIWTATAREPVRRGEKVVIRALRDLELEVERVS